MNAKGINPGRRRRLIIIGISFVVFIYLVQLFMLQIVNEDYKARADNNAFLRKTLYPSRGTLYDRNGNLLVFNQSAYDLMVVMKEVHPFDTLALCNILSVSADQFKKRMVDIKNRSINPGYSPYLPQTLFTQLGNKEYGVLQEFLYKFPGFYIQDRTVREYNYPNAAHVLGYIAPVDKQNIQDDDYYTTGDYIGKTGVERSYESILRGEKGVEILLRDAHGRIKGKYENGAQDVEPVSGKNLTLSIDIELQKYGEELMQNKLGAIVMIEPATGEVLCMVSSPTYDPSLFIGRQFGVNYKELAKDPFRPLLDRSLGGIYPPGSTFKTAQALVFLQEDVITPTTAYSCFGGWPLNNGRPACHAHGSPLSLAPALGTSCNAYFSWGLHAMLNNKKKYGTIANAMDIWRDHMVDQGFGYKLGIDLPGEKGGLIPNSQFYNKQNKRWNAFTVISIGIGQGEVAVTPLQVCNLAATIANRGFFYTPHVVKNIQDMSLDSLYTTRRYTKIASQHYEPVVEGMRLAVAGGTCSGAWMPDIEVCGKTGTSQNRGHDHSLFMGFAPKDNPRIAIAVLVENAGFGARMAVPIGRLMIEKYLKGEISESSKWLEYNVKEATVLHSALQKN